MSNLINFRVVFRYIARDSMCLLLVVFSLLLRGFECSTIQAGIGTPAESKGAFFGQKSMYFVVPSVEAGSFVLSESLADDEALSGIKLDSITSLFEQEFPDRLGKRMSSDSDSSDNVNADAEAVRTEIVPANAEVPTEATAVASNLPEVMEVISPSPTPINIPISTSPLPVILPKSQPTDTIHTVQYVILPEGSKTEGHRHRRQFRTPIRPFARMLKSAMRRTKMHVPKSSFNRPGPSNRIQSFPSSFNVVQIREPTATVSAVGGNVLSSNVATGESSVQHQASERSDDGYTTHSYSSGGPLPYSLSYPDSIDETEPVVIHNEHEHVVNDDGPGWSAPNVVSHSSPVFVVNDGPGWSAPPPPRTVIHKPTVHVINDGPAAGWSGQHIAHSPFKYLKDTVAHFPWTPYFGIKPPVPVFTVLGKSLDSTIGGAWAARKALKKGVGSVLSSKLRLGGTLAYVGSEVMAKVVDAASSI